MTRLAKATVTGESESEEVASPFAGLDRPCLVYVKHPGAGGEEDEKLNDLVFKSEKVGLAVKAFRTVQIAPEDANEDGLIREKGKTVPRLLVIDPVKEKITVLEKGKLKAGTLFKELKRAAASSYKEKLDGIVKKHLKILTEQDQIENELKVLRGKIARLKEEGAKAKPKLKKAEKELAGVQEEKKELKGREAALWKLTPKVKKTA